MDQTYKKLIEELMQMMTDKIIPIPRAMKIMLVAKYLERIADHAVHISEMVVFMVVGKIIRHQQTTLDYLDDQFHKPRHGDKEEPPANPCRTPFIKFFGPSTFSGHKILLEKGIKSPLLADGGIGTMAGIDPDVIPQDKQAVPDRTDQGPVVAAGEIGAPDGAGK